MNKILISVDTLNAIVGYLGSRPYQEVFNLIKTVQDEASGQLIATEPLSEELKED